jgi:putative effector of murein hydrolase LrgA (UPF0299 family)
VAAGRSGSAQGQLAGEIGFRCNIAPSTAPHGNGETGPMLQALGILLSCQLAGEIAVRAFALPIPGPVVGLLLLAMSLLLYERRGRISGATVDGTDLGKTANALLGALGILFVPAGVGVTQSLRLFEAYGLALSLALVGSTLATLVVTVWVFLGVARLTRRGSAK